MELFFELADILLVYVLVFMALISVKIGIELICDVFKKNKK